MLVSIEAVSAKTNCTIEDKNGNNIKQAQFPPPNTPKWAMSGLKEHQKTQDRAIAHSTPIASKY